MATSNADRRNRALLGDLPTDFLRIEPDAQQQQLQYDAQIAQSLQAGANVFRPSNIPKLCITVGQAKLSKNYSLVKMDPYCRIRLGNAVFETHTAHNGGKNPRWNKTFQCMLPKGVDSLFLEIFDERAFSMDDKVAWAHIQIPETVLGKEGEAVDEWFSLNGKQGDGKEGMVHLNILYTETAPQPTQQPTVYTTGAAPVMMIPAGMPVYYPPTVVGQQPYAQQPYAAYPPQQQPQVQPQQQQPQRPAGPAYTEDDVKQIKDMFPDVDQEVIKSLLEVNGGNKDLTINNLLSMQGD